MKEKNTNEEKNLTINNKTVNMVKKGNEAPNIEQYVCDGFKQQNGKGNETNPESIREKALKLISEDFGEKELKHLLEITKKLGKLPTEERQQLLEDVDNISGEELVQRLNGKHITKKEDQ